MLQWTPSNVMHCGWNSGRSVKCIKYYFFTIQKCFLKHWSFIQAVFFSLPRLIQTLRPLQVRWLYSLHFMQTYIMRNRHGWSIQLSLVNLDLYPEAFNFSISAYKAQALHSTCAPPQPHDLHKERDSGSEWKQSRYSRQWNQYAGWAKANLTQGRTPKKSMHIFLTYPKQAC